MCPSKRGPQGEGTRGPRQRLTGPSQGSQSTCGTSVPSRASAGQLRALQDSAADTGVASTSSASTASSLLSLANAVGGDGQRRSPEAGAGGWGRGLGVMWSSGRRGAAGSCPSAAGATARPPFVLVGKVFLFLSSPFCPFLLLYVCLFSCWESAGSFSLILIFH